MISAGSFKRCIKNATSFALIEYCVFHYSYHSSYSVFIFCVHFYHTFQQYVPLLAIFRNPMMQQIHWDNISVIAGYDLTPDAGTTLRKIINMNLLENLEK